MSDSSIIDKSFILILLAFIIIVMVQAMLGDGTVVVDFNSFGEGWPEIGLFCVLFVFYGWKMVTDS